MSIIRGLRYPTALAFGLLLTASMFWSLWSLTNVTFEIPKVPAVPIEWKPTLVDRPVEERIVEEITEIPPVILPPTIDGISDPATEIPSFVIRQVVEVPKLGGPVLVGSPDRDVQPLVRIEPEYPPRALANDIEGWVKVQFTISATGAVKDVVVVENSPSNIFDDASVKAVSRWRYNPRVEGAVAVERVGVQTILRFTLEE